MELVLGQQSSPSSDSAPETPVTEPTSLTSDLTPHISTSTPEPTTPSPAPSPEPPAAQPEAPDPPTPAETTPTEPDVQDDDQVTGETWKTWNLDQGILKICSGKLLEKFYKLSMLSH